MSYNKVVLASASQGIARLRTLTEVNFIINMDEPVDPYPDIRDKCGGKPKCKDAMEKYQACTTRVTNKGFGTCEPWYFDFISCVDHCAAPEIFKVMK